MSGIPRWGPGGRGGPGEPGEGTRAPRTRTRTDQIVCSTCCRTLSADAIAPHHAPLACRRRGPGMAAGPGPGPGRGPGGAGGPGARGPGDPPRGGANLNRDPAPRGAVVPVSAAPLLLSSRSSSFCSDRRRLRARLRNVEMRGVRMRIVLNERCTDHDSLWSGGGGARPPDHIKTWPLWRSQPPETRAARTSAPSRRG